MAQRMGCGERVALYQNVPKLPFTNAALATAVGLTVEDFAELEVTRAACNVVFDALAESRSGLIPFATLDARRAALEDAAGAFNELTFRTGLYKSRALIIIAWFLFGKGNFVWVLVSVKFLHAPPPGHSSGRTAGRCGGRWPINIGPQEPSPCELGRLTGSRACLWFKAPERRPNASNSGLEARRHSVARRLPCRKRRPSAAAPQPPPPRFGRREEPC